MKDYKYSMTLERDELYKMGERKVIDTNKSQLFTGLPKG